MCVSVYVCVCVCVCIYIYICVCVYGCAIHLKLTQYCKSTTFQLENNLVLKWVLFPKH